MEITKGNTIFAIVHSKDFNSRDEASIWAIENTGDHLIRKLPKKEKYRVYFEETYPEGTDKKDINNFVCFGILV